MEQTFDDELNFSVEVVREVIYGDKNKPKVVTSEDEVI